ncbi:hypothetical protein CBR_g41141 [Chara braunii]|uniref:Uncharacterized protein n=1 Tax=Chara braunii TaxID=69332 RepID=A0A388LV85_CHABU|nr:hypothetical protein CBR_g41141 [Chara braunii]|eukprot:GBG86237.1 hypothetical protein CBR_g41141 [Chara braunii]
MGNLFQHKEASKYSCGFVVSTTSTRQPKIQESQSVGLDLAGAMYWNVKPPVHGPGPAEKRSRSLLGVGRLASENLGESQPMVLNLAGAMYRNVKPPAHGPSRAEKERRDLQ